MKLIEKIKETSFSKWIYSHFIFPVIRYISTVKSFTLADFIYTGFFVASNICQSIIYWNFCKILLKNDIPITVVLTGSMEPGFNRGDVMPVHTWNNSAIKVGDIVVY